MATKRYYSDTAGVPVEIPEFLPFPEWQDCSWHNDVSPHSRKYLSASECEDIICVWVSEASPSDREYPEDPRYVVEVIIDEDDFDKRSLMRSSDEREVQTAIAQCEQAWTAGGREALRAFRDGYAVKETR